MKFYIISALNNIVEDYVTFDEKAFQDIYIGCINSEFQHIDKKTLTVYTSDSGGIEFPDFMYDGAVPLFSDKLFGIVKDGNIDYVFTKEVSVVSSITDEVKKYHLFLPPRIDCLDEEKSIYEEFTDSIFTIKDVEKCIINDKKIGNYNIFKIDKTTDNNIYVTENFMKLLKSVNPSGVGFTEVT